MSLLRWTSGFARARRPFTCIRSIQSGSGLPVDANADAILEGFEALRFRPQIIDALRTAFPNVQSPTRVQRTFIEAIQDHKDVMVKDATGSGKTFGITLALLNQPRISKPDRTRVNGGDKVPINSLIIVPHKDLAFQIQHWTQRIVSALPPSLLNAYSSVAKVVVRGTGVSPAEQAAELSKDPPHILIGTPQAIWDIMEHDKQALQPQYLNTIVVDEVDYLIPSIPRGMNQFKRRKMEKQLSRHPSLTATIIDEILKTRPQKEARGVAGEVWRDLPMKQRQVVRPPLQLVFSSATLRTHMDQELRRREGWITKGSASFQQVIGKPKKTPSAPRITPTQTVLGGSNISHSILIVDKDGTAVNVDGAVERLSASEPVVGEEVCDETVDQDIGVYDNSTDTLDYVNELELDTQVSIGGVRKPMKTNLAVIETVAACFAMDVPRVAMLVLPASSPVHAFVSELRELGVNAHGLDLLAEDRGRAHLLRGPSDVAVPDPTLLVATEASVRGVDLPELSHVFCLAIPANRKADGYLHLAGRVGRFGRPGQVITILEKYAEDSTPSKVPQKMQQLMKELKIVPTKFEHFG